LAHSTFLPSRQPVSLNTKKGQERGPAPAPRARAWPQHLAAPSATWGLGPGAPSRSGRAWAVVPWAQRASHAAHGPGSHSAGTPAPAPTGALLLRWGLSLLRGAGGPRPPRHSPCSPQPLPFGLSPHAAADPGPCPGALADPPKPPSPPASLLPGGF